VQDSLVAFNYVIEHVVKRGEDHVHLLHVVPDLFTSPASGSIHYCSSPDPETERALVGADVASSPAAEQPMTERLQEQPQPRCHAHINTCGPAGQQHSV
jgi:hypothetical protein